MEINAYPKLTDIYEYSYEIFRRIITSRSVPDLKAILDDEELSKYRMSTDRYHKLDLTITKELLQSSISSGFIRNDGSLNEDMLSLESATTQLLYAFLWKQGDLQKVKYIVQGINGNEPVPDSGMVLYYFGKHLADKKHPIIDQHVIRAFAMASNKEIYNVGLLTKKDKENILAYIGWFQHSLPPEISNSEDCRYQVDQVLYALGKRIKKDFELVFQKIY